MFPWIGIFFVTFANLVSMPLLQSKMFLFTKDLLTFLLHAIRHWSWVLLKSFFFLLLLVSFISPFKLLNEINRWHSGFSGCYFKFHNVEKATPNIASENIFFYFPVQVWCKVQSNRVEFSLFWYFAQLCTGRIGHKGAFAPLWDRTKLFPPASLICIEIRAVGMQYAWVRHAWMMNWLRQWFGGILPHWCHLGMKSSDIHYTHPRAPTSAPQSNISKLCYTTCSAK